MNDFQLLELLREHNNEDLKTELSFKNDQLLIYMSIFTGENRRSYVQAISFETLKLAVGPDHILRDTFTFMYKKLLLGVEQ